jgi:hypothetical protein
MAGDPFPTGEQLFLLETPKLADKAHDSLF